MSTSKHAIPTIKFDGKKWEEYDYELKSCLLISGCKHLIEAPFGQQNVVGRPSQVATLSGTSQTAHVAITAAADGFPAFACTETTTASDVTTWDTLNAKGLGILKVSISFAVAQCLPTGADGESLLKCYYTIRNRYRQVTASSTSIECHRYFTTIFDDTKPFTEQIDILDEIYSRIVAAGMTISDPLRAMRYLSALPLSYDSIRETIGSSIDANLAGIKPNEVRTRILAAETLRNGSTLEPGIAAIHRPSKNNSKVNCNWCSVANHTEAECKRKHVQKMSKDDARADVQRVRKERAKEREEKQGGSTNAANASLSTFSEPRYCL